MNQRAWIGAVMLASWIWASGCAPKVSVRPGEGGVPGPSAGDLRKPVDRADFEKALKTLQGQEFSRKNADAFMTVAQFHFNEGNVRKALEYYQPVVAAATGGPAHARAQYMVGHCYYEMKDHLPALSAFRKTAATFPGSPWASPSRQMTDFILEFALSTDELRAYLQNEPDPASRCTALFQLGRRESDDGMGAEAVEHLELFQKECPNHASMTAAGLLLADWKNRREGTARKIAVLAPVTGRYASFGAAVVNGVRLAFEEAQMGGNAFGESAAGTELVVKDTQGDPIVAVRVFRQLVEGGGVDVVIGPVTANEISSVAPLANDLRVVMISPSASREGLSALGPYIFRNSMTNEMQGRVMARYAVSELGLKRFAVLAPDDGYGDTLSRAFEEEAVSRGATVSLRQKYYPRTTDFKRQIMDLGGYDPTERKENDRENDRRSQQLEYSLRKSLKKFLMEYSASSGASVVIALAPLPEGLTNTVCPSIQPFVQKALQEEMEKTPRLVVRNSDLVAQAVTRLPDDVRGTTLPAEAEDWAEVAREVQASLLLTGRIVETDPPGEWGNDDTWDYVVELEARWAGSTRLRKSTDRIPYRILKSPEFSRRPTDYEAVYLPAHTLEVPLLMTQIRFYDLEPVLLGGHLWEDKSVLKDGGAWEKGAYFVTGFYADGPDGDVQDFVKRYQQKYASKPDLLAAQSYDAARMVLKAVDGARGGEEIRQRLSRINGFKGVSGKTSFNGGGEAEKEVPVLKIENGRFQQVQ